MARNKTGSLTPVQQKFKKEVREHLLQTDKRDAIEKALSEYDWNHGTGCHGLMFADPSELTPKKRKEILRKLGEL